jgi:SAM-dependent methyltransferase
MSIEHISCDVCETEDGAYVHERYWKERALQLLLEEIENPVGVSLLDYGCGRGEFSVLAKESGFYVSGVDIDPACVELTRRHVEADQIDPEDYLESMLEKSVDVISCLHVLEHVENPKRLLCGMRRAARRYVLIAVPNLQSFRSRRSNPLHSVNEGHLQGWDRETLCNLAVRHCGLELIGFTSDMTKLPCVSWRIYKMFGAAAEKAVNLNILSRLWPRNSISIIALFKVPAVNVCRS